MPSLSLLSLTSTKVDGQKQMRDIWSVPIRHRTWKLAVWWYSKTACSAEKTKGAVITNTKLRTKTPSKYIYIKKLQDKRAYYKELKEGYVLYPLRGVEDDLSSQPGLDNFVCEDVAEELLLIPSKKPWKWNVSIK